MHYYVIKLKNNKYYITESDSSRLKLEDFYLPKVFWLVTYAPEMIDEVVSFPQCSLDEFVIDKMAKHGIDRVRGGSYSDVFLSLKTRGYLMERIKEKQSWWYYAWSCNWWK